MGALTKLANVFSKPLRPSKSTQYMRGERSPFFFNWRPALRDARDDVISGYLPAASRAIDMMHNSGWMSGGIDQAISGIMGDGLRLNAMPDGEVIGWDEKTASQWARMVERKFEIWSGQAYECDLQGKMNLAQITAAALRQWFATGEIVSTIPWRPRPGAKTGTKVYLWPSHKLVQDTDMSQNLWQGVRVDDVGLPISYRFHVESKNFMNDKIDVRARDEWGRPVVVHVFEGNPSQMRGITPMAPALRVMRQFDQLADATLTGALLSAIFAATIESDTPSEQILQALQDEEEQQGIGAPTFDGWFDARSAWYKHTKIDLGTAGKIAHLFPGEKLKFNATENPNDNYEAFAKFLLREVARCIGITFEQFTGDYTGATYSSVRMSTAEAWNITRYRRKNIATPFVQPVYEAWLEEAIESGEVPLPGGVPAFLENRAAIARAVWRGPAKPQADDNKAAKAHETWGKLGVLSDEAICADLGLDWEDVYAQRAREKQAREELGIDGPEYAGVIAGNGDEEDDDDDDARSNSEDK